jgi:hypothetical protein
MDKISGRPGVCVENELVLDAGTCKEKLLARKSEGG